MNARIPASLPRRIGSAFYDLLVVVALWMFVYFPLIASGRFDGAADDLFHPLHLALRLAIAFGYFGWCWTHGGSTLGALAWKLTVVRSDDAPLAWRDAAARFGVALLYLVPLALIELLVPATQSAPLFYGALLGPFALGLGSSRFDPEQRAFHERFLMTRLTTRLATRSVARASRTTSA